MAQKIYYPKYKGYNPMADKLIQFADPPFSMRVFVWHSKNQMLKIGSKQGTKAERKEMNYTAFCVTDRRNRNSMYLGDLHFCRGLISLETVAHEISHCAMRWGFLSKGVFSDRVPKKNEMVAKIQGNFTL